MSAGLRAFFGVGGAVVGPADPRVFAAGAAVSAVRGLVPVTGWVGVVGVDDVAAVFGVAVTGFFVTGFFVAGASVVPADPVVASAAPPPGAARPPLVLAVVRRAVVDDPLASLAGAMSPAVLPLPRP